MNAIKLQ